MEVSTTATSTLTFTIHNRNILIVKRMLRLRYPHIEITVPKGSRLRHEVTISHFPEDCREEISDFVNKFQ